MRDIELAFQFPAHISDQKRKRLARLGALFLLLSLFGVPLLVIFLR